MQSRQLGYNLSHTYRQNLYDQTSITTESINIPALAYMDDTNWISDSEQNMASILTISKEFFSFTNILVNAYLPIPGINPKIKKKIFFFKFKLHDHMTHNL